VRIRAIVQGKEQAVKLQARVGLAAQRASGCRKSTNRRTLTLLRPWA
jgi:hypothetical protein